MGIVLNAAPTGLPFSFSSKSLGLGKLLLDRLTEMATASGCYKIILNCAQKNIGFYEKCGLVVKEVSMAKYLDR